MITDLLPRTVYRFLMTWGFALAIFIVNVTAAWPARSPFWLLAHTLEILGVVHVIGAAILWVAQLFYSIDYDLDFSDDKRLGGPYYWGYVSFRQRARIERRRAGLAAYRDRKEMGEEAWLEREIARLERDLERAKN